MNEFEDKELRCVCGKQFVWTSGEQEFLNDLYLKGKIPSIQVPRRCRECRAIKKKEREQMERRD